MKDKDKTHKQLTKELTQLRRRIAELEAIGSKRNQFEESLRTERDKAQQYLDIAEVMLVVLDKKGTITLLNRKGSQILGYNEGELIGKNWFTTCLPSHLRKKVKSVFKKLMTGEGKQKEFYENTVLTKSGTERTIAWHNTVLKDRQGTIIGTLSSGEDITERKGVEDRLRDTSLFLRSILDSSSSISIIFTDREQNIVFWNKGAEDIFGYKAEEMVGHHTVDILYPDEGDTKQTVEDIRSYILNKKRGLRREIKEVTKDGRILWISLTSTPRFDENKNVIGILGIGEDITERKQIEEEKRASEKRYKTLFDSASDAVFIVNMTGQFIDVNEVACKRLGYRKEELLKMTPMDIDSPEYASLVQKRIKMLRQRGHLFFETVQMRRDGTPITTELSSRVIEYDGKPAILSIARDITDRKQIEDALRESEERFRRVVETMEVGLGAIDENGVLTYVNEYLAKMLGYSIEEMIGRSTLDFCEEKSRKILEEIFRKRRAGMRDSTPYEVTWERKDGQKVYAILSPTPLFDADGHYTGSFAIHTDITERKRMEEALRESEEKYRNLAERANDGIGIGQDGIICYANTRLAQLGGYAVEEIMGEPFFHFFAPDEIPKIRDRYQRRMAGEDIPSIYETALKHKDGRRIEVEINAGIIHYQGKPAELVMFRDITERKQSEEALYRSYQQMQEMLGSTVNALASTVEMKDQYTAGHQPRVTQLACAIGEEMGLSEEQIEGIHMAGLIHDIGKIMVPAEILNKPGSLTEIQYEMIKMHPRASFDILKGITFPWPVAEIVLQHHERMDGSGYPQGLSGEEILLEARILAVANVVEAMISHRPYREAHDIKEALKEISQHKGVLYDPVVVDACLKLFSEKRFTFEQV